MTSATHTEIHLGPPDEPHRYVLDRRVGIDREAATWHGWRRIEELELEVRVRLTHPESSPYVASDGTLRRWRWVAELANTLQHPAVEPVRDLFSTDAGDLAMATNWVDGDRLDAWVAVRPHRDATAVISILAQLAEVIDLLHRGVGGQPIVHRSLVPSAVLVGRGSVALEGLGTARPTGTHLDAVPGSPPVWTPPEVLKGASYSPAGDRWCFGALAHLLLTGEAPALMSPVETVDSLLACNLLRGDAELVGHLLRLLAPEPKLRPTTLVRWVAELDQQLRSPSGDSTADARTTAVLATWTTETFDAVRPTHEVTRLPAPADALAAPPLPVAVPPPPAVPPTRTDIDPPVVTEALDVTDALFGPASPEIKHPEIKHPEIEHHSDDAGRADEFWSASDVGSRRKVIGVAALTGALTLGAIAAMLGSIDEPAPATSDPTPTLVTFPAAVPAAPLTGFTDPAPVPPVAGVDTFDEAGRTDLAGGPMSWQVDRGTWSVLDGAAWLTGVDPGTVGLATVDPGAPTTRVSATITDPAPGTGLNFRGSGVDSYWALAFLPAAEGNWQLLRITPGSIEAVAAFEGPASGTATAEVRLDGATIEALINGEVMASISDPRDTGATRVGIGTVAADVSGFDDFSYDAG